LYHTGLLFYATPLFEKGDWWAEQLPSEALALLWVAGGDGLSGSTNVPGGPCGLRNGLSGCG
jgi:hypothetical protein